MTANRKQHHYPQTHLRYFANGERIRGFNLPKPGCLPKVFETTTRNVAHQRDLYTIVTDDGVRDFKFDDDLQAVERQVNSAFAPLFEDRDITDAELAELQVLAAIQNGRKPHAVHDLTRVVGEIHVKSRFLYAQHAPHLSAAEIDERLRENWGQTKLTGDAALDPKNLALTVLNQTVFEFSRDFVDHYHACLVTSAAHDFMTGDTPVVYFDPTREQHPFFGFDRSLATIEVTFPLTRRHLLFMSHLPLPRHVTANRVGVAMLNGRTAYGCSQVYAFPTPDTRSSARQLMDLKTMLGAMNLTALIAATIIDGGEREEIKSVAGAGRWARLIDSFQHGRTAVYE